MKRIFHHYEKWEDWKDGLYVLAIDDPIEVMIRRSERVLCTVDLLRWAMMQTLYQYPCAAEVNLSNSSRNRQAWLGQAAACFVVGASEDMTKEAWHRLSVAQQDAANLIADEVIAWWESEQCLKS